MKWWLSYAADDGFHGAVIVDVPEIMEDVGFLWACARSRAVGANPGGQVFGFPFPETDDPSFAKIQALPLETLLTVDQLRAAGVDDLVHPTDLMEVADA
jgi:hypothetical protein